MKVFTLLLCLLAMTLTAESHDFLLLKDGQKIKNNVIKIDSLNAYTNTLNISRMVSSFISKDKVETIKYDLKNEIIEKKEEVFSFNSHTSFELGIGGAKLSKNETNDYYGWGFCGGLRYRIDIPRSKFSIAPVGNFRLYSAAIEGVDDWTDRLWIFNTGIQLSYRLFSNNKSKLLVFGELTNSWIINFYSYDNNDISNDPIETVKDIDIFNGSSISNKIGCRYYFSKVYFEISYDILNSQVELRDELKDLLDEENIQYNSTFELPLNAFNIILGFSL